LQDRLDSALATRVEKLSQYRSEFFGRLRTAIGDHPDMRIEGDRFVFQSEVLFASGSAEIGEAGQRQLAQLARSLHIISRGIPSDIDWVLRVDGHTDRRAISNADYPSNWELSTARAITVVRFLIGQGVPPYRLAATGFGEFQPLDPGDDEIAYRRNRRIEFKLTRK
jgi:chemotaxis protein MotB